MIIVDLYRYEEGGIVTVTPNKRDDADESSRKRLIAEGDNILTDGNTETQVIDVLLDEVELWREIVSENIATEEDYQNALSEFGVTL